MTTAEKIKAASDSYAAFRAAQATFYTARMEYAKSLGSGTATEAQRRNVETLKAAYEAA